MLTAREKLIVSYYTDKRDGVSTDCFVADLAKRIAGRTQVTTDSFKPYPDTLRRYLLDRLDYAVMQKKFAALPGEVEAARR